MTTPCNSFIDLAALQEIPVNQSPFPYMIVPHFLKSDHLNSLVNEFPDLLSRGSVPAASVDCSPRFRQLLAELEGPALRALIAHKFSMDLTDSPTMLTLRGVTTERDGLIHADSKSKLITLLLYMNARWESDQGKLRLLNNKDSLDDYFEEIPPIAGHCLIFKVTPNGWHGHHPFVGKRLSLQLNYLTSQGALTKHLNHHRLTAFFKRYLPSSLRTKGSREEIY